MRVPFIDSNERRVLTVEDYNRLAEAINANAIVSTDGIEVLQSPGGIGLSVGGQESYRMARVLSSESISDYKWEYRLAKVNPASSGGVSSAWVDTSVNFTAYNLVEDMNQDSESGVENVIGNGVDVSDTGSLAAGTMVPQPCPVGCVVMCIKAGASWWFSYENGIDGEC